MKWLAARRRVFLLYFSLPFVNAKMRILLVVNLSKYKPESANSVMSCVQHLIYLRSRRQNSENPVDVFEKPLLSPYNTESERKRLEVAPSFSFIKIVRRLNEGHISSGYDLRRNSRICIETLVNLRVILHFSHYLDPRM